MADHASNIAEEVIHLVEGEIIRHAQYGNEQSSPR
jgi:phosphate uptake regulator